MNITWQGQVEPFSRIRNFVIGFKIFDIGIRFDYQVLVRKDLQVDEQRAKSPRNQSGDKNLQNIHVLVEHHGM